MKEDEKTFNKKTSFYQKFFHKKINEMKGKKIGSGGKNDESENFDLKERIALKPHHRKSKTISGLSGVGTRIKKVRSDAKLKRGSLAEIKNQKSFGKLKSNEEREKKYFFKGKKNQENFSEKNSVLEKKQRGGSHRKVLSSGFMLDKMSSYKNLKKKPDIGQMMKEIRSESEKKLTVFKIKNEQKSFKRRENSNTHSKKRIGVPKIDNENIQKNKIIVPKEKIEKKEFKILKNIRENEKKLPKVDKSKVIIKDFGSIKAFAVNTHVGTVRGYNEDRVSILLNAQQR